MPSGVGDTNGSNGRTHVAELRSACGEAACLTVAPIASTKRSEVATPRDDVYLSGKSITGTAVVNGCLLAHARPKSVSKTDLDDSETNILRTQLDAIGALGPSMRKLGTNTWALKGLATSCFWGLYVSTIVVLGPFGLLSILGGPG